jgi:cytochrome c oxidase assembly factor CtaG
MQLSAAARPARGGLGIAVAATAMLVGAPAHAHVPGDAIATIDWWPVEPWLLALLALAAALYAAGFARLWRHAATGRAVHARRALAFAGGWLVTAAALVGPLDALSAQLFSAHMVQHEGLMVVAAPLFVLGRPLGAWTWALPQPWRRALGAFFHRPAWRLPWLVVTRPLAAWLIHAIALWLWHIPSWFEAALASEGVHVLQHASFLVSALLYWWSVLGARRNGGAAMASLFTTMIHTAALGALLALSPVAWYPTYADRTIAFGLDPLEDQQLGGFVMWIPAGFAYVACGLATAARWLLRDDRARRAA